MGGGERRGGGPAGVRALLLGGPGGGGEEVLIDSLTRSPPPGVDYRVVTGHHESVGGARALRVREILFNRLVHPYLWPLLGLRAYRVAPEVDLVHVHNYPTWLDLPDGCPVVYTLGGGTYPHYLERYLGWPAWRIRRLYRRARAVYRTLGIRNEIVAPGGIDAMVVLSAFAADRLAAWGVDRERIHVIPPALDLPPPSPPPPAEAPFHFLLVGREPMRKGADLAVRALARVREAGLEARLTLVGDPAYPVMARSAGPGVEGLAKVPRERLLGQVVPSAHALLVPSRAEGFGLAAVEALGAGRPLVVSDRDALPEIAGDVGRVVGVEDEVPLAAAMEALARDPVAAAQEGRRARARYEASYDPDASRAALGSLYRRLTGGAA